MSQHPGRGPEVQPPCLAEPIGHRQLPPHTWSSWMPTDPAPVCCSMAQKTACQALHSGVAPIHPCTASVEHLRGGVQGSGCST